MILKEKECLLLEIPNNYPNNYPIPEPWAAPLHGTILKNTLGFQGVVVSRPGRLAVACAGQSVIWATGLTCDLRLVRLTCDLRRPGSLQNRVLSILVRYL